jgi:ssDNA-binding Zn-finger/Zn-ribbon topoisomerase 1
MILHTTTQHYSHQSTPCPDCGAPLRIRRRHSDGVRFLGCSTYPDCQHTQPLPPGYSTRAATDHTREAELLATIARLRQEIRELNAALERAAEWHSKTLHELIDAQIAAERQQSAPEALHRELTRLIASCHPDKWGGSEVAKTLCQEVVKLRERLDKGEF